MKKIFLILTLCFIFFMEVNPVFAAENTWAIYFYLCGSDLEADKGLATKNLNALKSVKLPENVKFVIQTGGAQKWKTKGISGKKLGRYVYDSTGFNEVAKLDDASMGSEETLQDFLKFCKENYPAERRAIIFWDHGGGSLGGFCIDQKFGNVLSLNDLKQALESVEEKNTENPAFDLVLFDTCLMATIETANTLYGFSKFLVASEETMPYTGTDYANWVGALSKNPAMDGENLGKIICETYLPYCRANDSEDMAMLSLIDLSKIPALNEAYENFGKEALQAASINPQYFFTAFDRVANGVENYGADNYGNTPDMIDLGSFAESVENMQTAAAFTQAVKNAVVVSVAGPYRRYGMGLSGYYSLDANSDVLNIYTSLNSSSPTFATLYQTMLNTNFYFDAEKISNVPVTLDENNVAVVTLSPEDANAISNVDFLLCFYKPNGELVYLGSDDKLNVNWEEGIFKEDFDGMWPTLNGHFIPMNLADQRSDYNLYYSYILLNGKKFYLKSAYNMASKNFEIIGAQRVLKGGLLDREIVQLKVGDKIVPLFIDEKDKEYKGAQFILESAPILQDEPLPDDTYAFAFRFTAPHNASVVSKTIHFTVDDGKITAHIPE